MIRRTMLVFILLCTIMLGLMSKSSPTVEAQGNATRVIGPWGERGDIPVAGDFDGDLLGDIALFQPSNGHWFFDTNLDGVYDYRIQNLGWGQQGDIPIAGDFNGNGRSSIGLFRPSTGEWFFDTNFDGNTDYSYEWTGPIDATPFVMDHDQDGDDDIGLFFSTGAIAFYGIRENSTVKSLVMPVEYGENGYTPVAGQFTNDSFVDLAFVSDSAREWVIDWNLDGNIEVQENISSGNYEVVAADFDNNGWTDLAQFDLNTFEWTINYRGEPIFPTNTLTFSIDNLRVINGEEDATAASSGEDELYLVYLVTVVNRSASRGINEIYTRDIEKWGIQRVRAGSVIPSEEFAPLQVDLLGTQTAQIELILVESEGENAANFILSGEWIVDLGLFDPSSGFSQLKRRFSDALTSEYRDVEDILGIKTLQLVPVSNYIGTNSRTFNISGENNLDAYEYEIEYTVTVQ